MSTADFASFASAAPALVGRERELARLRVALAAAQAGRGGLVLISGEAGIGKTALAEALTAEAATQGERVLVGRCYDLTETPPYGPWREALAHTPHGNAEPTSPDLASDGAGSQVALFAQVHDYLAALAQRQPVVLLLDDLHWADPASLDLLRVFARHLADVPLLLLAIYRAEEVPRHHPLSVLLPVLVREARAARLDLRPLDDDAVRALVTDRYALPADDTARLVTQIQAQAEGNALYLGELLRSLEESAILCPSGTGWALGDPTAQPVPPLLRQVIEGRLARLGAEAERLLAVAAVIGQEAPLALWAAVAAVTESALAGVVERAAEAHLIAETAGGTRARFAHALIREALYEGAPPSQRRRWHRQVGEALAAEPHPDPDTVAFHLWKAEDERAVTWLIRAGERARWVHAGRTAAERFAAALALLERRDAAPGERGWLRYYLAQLRRRDDPRQALVHLDAAVPLASAAGDGGLACISLYLRGLIQCQVGELRCGLATLDDARSALEGLPTVALAQVNQRVFGDVVATHLGAADSWWTVLPHLARAGRCAEAVAAGQRLGAQPPPGAGPKLAEAHGRAHLGLGLARTLMGQPDAADAAFTRARASFRATGWPWVFGDLAAAELAAVLAYQPDDIAERRRLAGEAERARTGAEDVGLTAPPRLGYVPLLLLEGSWTEARALACAGSVGGSDTAPRQEAAGWLAWLAREHGEPALAWAQVEAAHPAGPATAPGDHSFVPATVLQRLAAALALDAGDLPLARAWLAAHDRWLAWAGAVLGQTEGQLGWAAYYRAAGDLALARDHADRALTYASAPRQPLALLASHRFLGELAISTGCYADAQAHLAAAHALAEACAAPYERALTLLALAELRASERQHEPTRLLLTDATALLRPLEARPALARAAALEARLPVMPAPAPATLPFGLTVREAEVLRLVAEGLTDAQVAARLFVSPHTVGTHLRAIYGKLGVTSRAAATRLALVHHLD